jgi:hypothetical protein
MDAGKGQGNRRAVTIGTILIVLGLVFFVGQFLDLEGPLFLVGLGSVFLAAYAIGRRLLGFLIAGNVLLAIGVFSGLENALVIPGTLAGALFFVMLGAAFVGVYVIHSRVAASWGTRNWAIITGLGLWAFALFVLAVEYAVLLPPAVWDTLWRLWPLLLIGIGIWQILARLRAAKG